MDLYVRLGALLALGLITAPVALWLDWRHEHRRRAVNRLGRLHRLPLSAGMERRNPAYDGFMRALELR